jgi:hypothetical protein
MFLSGKAEIAIETRQVFQAKNTTSLEDRCLRTNCSRGRSTPATLPPPLNKAEPVRIRDAGLVWDTAAQSGVDSAPVTTASRIVEHTNRHCCTSPGFAHKNSLPSDRCPLAELPGSQSAHRMQPTPARHSWHPRRWQYSVLLRFPDAPTEPGRCRGAADVEWIAIPAGYKCDCQAAIDLSATHHGSSNSLVLKHTRLTE